MPFIDDINNLREGTWKEQFSNYPKFIPLSFEDFFDRIVNKSEVVFRHSEDYKIWMEQLTQAIDTGIAPKGFDFFRNKDKNAIMGVYLAMYNMGVKGLILRQEFPPEQELSIDDEQELEDLSNQPVEPWAYLILYKTADGQKYIEPKMDKWLKKATKFSDKIKNNNSFYNSVLNEQIAMWNHIKGINERSEETKAELDKWALRTQGTEAVLRARAATAPWVDDWKWPQHKFRTGIIFGNQNWNGSVEDLGEDILQNKNKLNEYTHIKTEIRNKKMRGR